MPCLRAAECTNTFCTSARCFPLGLRQILGLRRQLLRHILRRAGSGLGFEGGGDNRHAAEPGIDGQRRPRLEVDTIQVHLGHERVACVLARRARFDAIGRRFDFMIHE